MSSKLQNIKAVKQMIAGVHKSQTKTTVGYTGKPKEKNVLETFEDGKPKIWIEADAKGMEWKIEQHDGFRSKKPANSVRDMIKDLLTAPKQCPCCGSKMKGVDEERLNLKMWFIHKKCFSCVLKEETKIRSKGKEAWTEYSRKKAKEWYEANRDAHNKKCLERYYAKKKAKDEELAKEL